MAVNPGIDARIEGRLGRITLQRPESLNALTTEMVVAIDEALLGWADSGLRAIVIDSSSRHFCAGGDVRRVREAALRGDWAAVDGFFLAEYRMNRRIAEYRTPVVSLIDGVCLGGGMGIAVHGHFRVMTERGSMAMPETAIGFLPDVGGSHFLSRLPGSIGLYLGLTGTRLGPGDAAAIGLATHIVPSDRIRELPGRIDGSDDAIERIIDAVSDHPPPALLVAQDEISSAFSAGSTEDILARLESIGGAWAADAAADLRRASPRSVEVAHDLIARGRERSLAECLDAEFAAGAHLIREGDFIEGVRARLVDKDERPAWLSA